MSHGVRMSRDTDARTATPEAMEAGRELDALIAERVMGIDAELIHTDGAPRTIAYRGMQAVVRAVDHYCTDIAAAWEVVEKMRADGWEFEIWDRDAHLTRAHGVPWGAEFSREGLAWEPLRRKGSADTAPLAICLAALASLPEEPK